MVASKLDPAILYKETDDIDDEDVEFDSAESFRSKIYTLKESYFPKVVSESTSTIDNVETGTLAQDIDVSDSMANYMSAISRNVKGAN